MGQYIDKDALVAEIERLKSIYDNEWDSKYVAKYTVLDLLKSNLDTLEVKEVDLDKEIEKSLKRHSMLAVGKKDFTDIAKHFFELGLYCSQTDDSYIEGVKGSYTTTDKD